MLPGDQLNVLLNLGGVGSWGLLGCARPAAPTTLKHRTNPRRASFRRCDSRTHRQGRFMADVPAVSTVELGHPVTLGVLMEPYNPRHALAQPNDSRLSGAAKEQTPLFL